MVFSILFSVSLPKHGLRTVEKYVVVSYEIVSKPEFEVSKRKGFVAHSLFLIQFAIIVICIAFLSCILAILHCMSVFAVSTALEDIPTSEILLSRS